MSVSSFFSDPTLHCPISLFAYSKGGTRNGKSYKSNSINVIEQWVDEFVFQDIRQVNIYTGFKTRLANNHENYLLFVVVDARRHFLM